MIKKLGSSDISFIVGGACDCYCNSSRFIGIAKDPAFCNNWCAIEFGITINNTCIPLDRGDVLGHIMSWFNGPSQSECAQYGVYSKVKTQ